MNKRRDPYKIQAEHKKKVIIYNGSNSLRIKNLKEIDESSLQQKKEFYDKHHWIYFTDGNSEKIRYRKTFLYILLIIGFIVIIFSREIAIKYLGGLIIFYSFFHLGEKKDTKKDILTDTKLVMTRV